MAYPRVQDLRGLTTRASALLTHLPADLSHPLAAVQEPPSPCLAVCCKCGTIAPGSPATWACPLCGGRDCVQLPPPPDTPLSPPEAAFVTDLSSAPPPPPKGPLPTAPTPPPHQFRVLRDFTLWLTQAVHQLQREDADQVINIALVLNGYVVWFYDDSPSHLTTWPHPRAHYNTSLHGIPGHRLWLTPDCPLPVIIAAWYSPSCGCPQLPSASILHHAPALRLPNAVYLHPCPGRTHLTLDVAQRSFVRPPGLSLLQGVPAAPVRPGATCFRPDHSLLLPASPWASHLQSLTFSPLNLRATRVLCSSPGTSAAS